MPATKYDLSAILADKDTFATTMIVALIDTYGTEFMTWAPETILLETKRSFNIDWPIANFDRLMAGILLLTTDNFYHSLPDFIELCNILSGSPASPGVFEPADVMECAWGITEALILSPPDSDEPFTEEVRSYIGKMVEMEGIINPPDILKIGIVAGGKQHKIHNDFSDDPELSAGIWQMEADKTAEINTIVKERLMLLVNQLKSLKLENGDVQDIASKMLFNLNQTSTRGSILS